MKAKVVALSGVSIFDYEGNMMADVQRRKTALLVLEAPFEVVRELNEWIGDQVELKFGPSTGDSGNVIIVGQEEGDGPG